MNGRRDPKGDVVTFAVRERDGRIEVLVPGAAGLSHHPRPGPPGVAPSGHGRRGARRPLLSDARADLG